MRNNIIQFIPENKCPKCGGPLHYCTVMKYPMDNNCRVITTGVLNWTDEFLVCDPCQIRFDITKVITDQRGPAYQIVHPKDVMKNPTQWNLSRREVDYTAFIGKEIDKWNRWAELGYPDNWEGWNK